MKAFDVTNKTPADFLASIQAALKGRSLGDIVSMRRDGKDVVIVFSRLGTSEVRYAVTEREGGFRCEKSSEKIALAHRAFRGEIERKLGKVLETLGATVER